MSYSFSRKNLFQGFKHSFSSTKAYLIRTIFLILYCSGVFLSTESSGSYLSKEESKVVQMGLKDHSSQQDIQVIKNISEFMDMIRPGDWIVLDIDNTLLKTGQVKRGPETILLNLDPKGIDMIKNFVRSYPATKKEKEIKVILSTKRDMNESDITHQQLEKIGLPINEIEILFDDPYEKEPQTTGTKFTKRLLSSPSLPKRILFVDSLRENLIDIKIMLSSNSNLPHIPIKLFQRESGYKLYESSDSTHSFPEDLDRFTFQKSLAGGSGGVHVLEFKEQLYTFKCVSDTSQMKEEITADALYRALGVPVPAFAIYDKLPKAISPELCKGPGPYRLASYINPGDQNFEKISQEIQKYFVVDAFLGNWDIVVDNFKNVVLDNTGKLWRVDNGGSLRYRAVAGKKDRDDLLKVNDLDTMRDPGINFAGSKAYGPIQYEELKVQAQHIFNNRQKLFETIEKLDNSIHLENPKELKEIIRLRLDYLTKRFQLVEEKKGNPQPKNLSQKNRKALASSAAGILIYSQHPETGESVVLIGKRTRHNWWSNFGGASDIEGVEVPDNTLADTAVRETQEESLGLISFTSQELANVPSHDIINAKDKILYRMYTAPHPYVARERFIKASPTPKYYWTSEYDDYAWISVSEILEALTDPKIITEEGFETSLIGDRILFPPFWEMLKEPEVRDVLVKINKKLTLTSLHTRRQSETILPPHLSLEDEKQELAEVTVAHGRVMGEIKEGKAQLSSTGSTLVKGQAVVSTPKQEVRDPKDQKVREGFQASFLRENEPIKEQIHAEQEFKIPETNQTSSHLEMIEKMEGYLSDIEASSLSEQLEKTPYTQTQAYLAYRMGKVLEELKGNSKEEVKTFLETRADFKTAGDDNYQKVLVEAMEEEKKSDHRKKIVFYHASDPLSTFLFDIFTAYRLQLKMLPSDQLTILRGLENSFNSVLDVEAFIEIFKDKEGHISNYSTKGEITYADVGLSVNPYLFGNDGVEKSATYYLFYTLSSAGAPDHEKLFNAFMAATGIPGHFKDYFALYQQYYMQEKNSNSKLYQIFIDPQVVDTVAYTSITGGDLVNFSTNDEQKTYHGFAKIITELRTSPDSFDSTLAKATSKGQINLNLLQGRLYLKPEIFHNPKYVTIKSYWRHKVSKEGETNYYQKLNAQVSHDLSNWLKSHTVETEKTFSEGHQALQKLYKNVYEGTTGLEFKEAERSPKTLLYNALTKGDLKTATKLIKENKLDLNEKFQNLTYKVGSNRESLLSAADLIPGESKDSWELLKLLIDHGFDPKVKLVGNDDMIVKFGIKRSDLSTIKYLHQLGIELEGAARNLSDFQGSPEDSLELVKLIVNSGIREDVNLFHFAVIKDHFEIIKYLYDQKIVDIERIMDLFHLCYPTYNGIPTLLKKPLDYVKFMHENGGDPSSYIENYVEAGNVDVLEYLFNEFYLPEYNENELNSLVYKFQGNSDNFEKFYNIFSKKYYPKIFVRVALSRKYSTFLLNLSNNIMNEILENQKGLQNNNYAILFKIITSDWFIESGQDIISSCQSLLSKLEGCKNQTEQCKNNYAKGFLLNNFINIIMKKESRKLQEIIKEVYTLYDSKSYTKEQVAQQIRVMMGDEFTQPTSLLGNKLKNLIEKDLINYQSLLKQAIEAIGNNNINLLGNLLSNGFDVNAQDERDTSLLHKAVIMQKIEIVKLLLKFGAEVNTINKFKVSPIKTAMNMKKGDMNIVELLTQYGAVK